MDNEERAAYDPILAVAALAAFTAAGLLEVKA